MEQLKSEKAKLYSEKIALENHLEAEQEFIMNKLQKQVRASPPLGAAWTGSCRVSCCWAAASPGTREG